jgi:hypothetical protein
LFPGVLRPSKARIQAQLVARDRRRTKKKGGITMSVFLRNGVYHYRFMHKGIVVRRSTKQSNHRIAEQMESVHKTARAKGEAGLGEKPD